MSFADHLDQHRNGDEYDLDAAETARAEEIVEQLKNSAVDLARVAAKAAKNERSQWSKRNTDSLRKQFAQPALSPALELEVLVPLGESAAVELGDMNHERIPLRKDLRTKHHLDEIRTFDTEMTFWINTGKALPAGMRIRDFIEADAADVEDGEE